MFDSTNISRLAIPAHISEIGFGAASIGNLYRELSDESAEEAVQQAWDAGIRYFDTAPFYGFGLSERRLGDVLRSQPRSSFSVSTKVGRVLRTAPNVVSSAERHGFCSNMPFEPEYDYSYDGIMRSHEASLNRLGLSSIDILYVHDIGEYTHGHDNAEHFRVLCDSGYRALDELRSSGAVGAIGLGVNEIAICNSALDHGDYDCFLLAGRYTLLEQFALETLFPRCSDRGVWVVVGGAYNSGILATGVSDRTQKIYFDYAPASDEIIQRVARIEQVCRAHGVTLAAAALQFPLAHPVVASVIPGMGSAHRVAQTVELWNESIPNSFWSDLRSENLIGDLVPVPTSELVK